MRIAAWVFLICTVASAVGAFVPAVELRIGGALLSKKATLSLYQASTDKELVRKFLSGYTKSGGRKYGAAIISALGARGKKAHLDDVHDAMDTLDQIKDEDVVTGARYFTIGLWVFVGLHVIMALLIFSNAMDGRFRPRTLAMAMGCALLVAAMGLAIHWACGEAVFEANDELGLDFAATSVGAWLIPVAACGALASLIVLSVWRWRRGFEAARAS